MLVQDHVPHISGMPSGPPGFLGAFSALPKWSQREGLGGGGKMIQTIGMVVMHSRGTRLGRYPPLAAWFQCADAVRTVSAVPVRRTNSRHHSIVEIALGAMAEGVSPAMAEPFGTGETREKGNRRRDGFDGRRDAGPRR